MKLHIKKISDRVTLTNLCPKAFPTFYSTDDLFQTAAVLCLGLHSTIAFW